MWRSNQLYLSTSLKADPLQRVSRYCVDRGQEVLEQWNIQISEFGKVIRMHVGREVRMRNTFANRRHLADKTIN